MSTDLLPTDQYYIRNEQTFAGRNRREDFSLLPKRVYCPTDAAEAQLASNLYSMAATNSNLFNHPQWKIEALRNGRYKVSARGAATGEINKRLYAILLPEPPAEEWIITRRNSDGPRSQYT
jgi:Peptidase inhibitor I66